MRKVALNIMRNRTGCSVFEQNGSIFKDNIMACGGSFITEENCFKIRGVFTSDIYFSKIMWFAIPTKGVMKKYDIIISYIEKGQHCIYRFRLGKKHTARVKQILIDNHINDRSGTVKEW